MMTPAMLNRQRRLSEAVAAVPQNVCSAHLVGIGGAGMRALAQLLVSRGWSVTGSDLNTSIPALENLPGGGLRIHQGHDHRHLQREAGVLVYSPAVGTANPERQEAARRGVPQLSYSQMLGWLMRQQQGLCVAGTHGKSTTTALAGHILQYTGKDPSQICGAELCGNRQSGRAGASELLLVEACEYQQSFLDLAPRHAVILAIEPDHFDCYATFAELQSSFAAFAAKIPAGGSLLVSGDSPASRSAGEAATVPVETFGLTEGCDWWAADLRDVPEGTRFRTFHKGDYFTEVFLPMRGSHNVANALAAMALCHRAGVDPAGAREALAEFPGVRRRYEAVGSYRGMTLIDDYAHHPTEVLATLKTARATAGKRKLWCVFQPHQVSRTESLMDDFAASFGAADEVVIAPVFAARESTETDVLAPSARLAEGICRNGIHARSCNSLDHIVATLDHDARPGDVVVTMGAGDIDRVHHEFSRRLRRNHPQG
ncbi:MAG: UDP-N-acetylmuramate--L-alanine ligase [Planctomycetaceae bacterium]|nr:UDP-N-acetylmuramate--L-alanine ligase [Planctomycetaceae bacterium]